jgi:hypothetical protein
MIKFSIIYFVILNLAKSGVAKGIFLPITGFSLLNYKIKTNRYVRREQTHPNSQT